MQQLSLVPNHAIVGVHVGKVARDLGIDIKHLKTLEHLALCELGRTLIALIDVFVVDGPMMFERIFTALDHQ